jgi:ligand-binding SRPBCC domain-containing protein
VSALFQSEQWVAAPPDRVFAFFANPHNLLRIMPPGLGTKLVKLNLVPPPGGGETASVNLEPMAGTGTEMMVAFRVIPYLPIHDRWTVQITDFSLNKSFRDVQRQGPFRHWEHIHSFERQTVGGREGTLVRDAVKYEVGFGVVGSALERLVFQRLVRATFSHRRKALERLFSEPSLADKAG